MENGQITEVGSYTELINQNQAFAEFLRSYASNEANDEDDPGEFQKVVGPIVLGFVC